MTFAGFIYAFVFLSVGLVVGFIAGSASSLARLQSETTVDEIERFNRRNADFDRTKREVFAYMQDQGKDARLDEIRDRWGRAGVLAVQEISDTLGGTHG